MTKKFVLYSALVGFVYQVLTLVFVVKSYFTDITSYFFVEPSYKILVLLCGFTEPTILTTNICQHGGGVTILIIISLLIILAFALFGYILSRLYKLKKTYDQEKY